MFLNYNQVCPNFCGEKASSKTEKAPERNGWLLKKKNVMKRGVTLDDIPLCACCFLCYQCLLLSLLLLFVAFYTCSTRWRRRENSSCIVVWGHSLHLAWEYFINRLFRRVPFLPHFPSFPGGGKQLFIIAEMVHMTGGVCDCVRCWRPRGNAPRAEYYDSVFFQSAVELDPPDDRICRPRGSHVWGHDYE